MEPFLHELAQARPDPGGGAAAAYGANLGLALLEKVLRLEDRRRTNPDTKPPTVWKEALEQLRLLSETLEHLREEDVRAYFNLTTARTAGNAAALTAALQEAVDCPRRIGQQAYEALELLAWAGKNCQRHLLSDLLVASEFLGAAFRGAHHIAAANLSLVQGKEECRTLAADLEQSHREGEDLYQRVRTALMARENAVDSCRG